MAYSPLIPKYSLSRTPSMRSKVKREWKAGGSFSAQKDGRFFPNRGLPPSVKGLPVPHSIQEGAETHQNKGDFC